VCLHASIWYERQAARAALIRNSALPPAAARLPSSPGAPHPQMPVVVSQVMGVPQKSAHKALSVQRGMQSPARGAPLHPVLKRFPSLGKGGGRGELRVTRGKWGGMIAVTMNGFMLSVVHVLRIEEFSGQESDNQFGSIFLSFIF
jgi:hypothetical protein